MAYSVTVDTGTATKRSLSYPSIGAGQDVRLRFLKVMADSTTDPTPLFYIYNNSVLIYSLHLDANISTYNIDIFDLGLGVFCKDELDLLEVETDDPDVVIRYYWRVCGP